MITSLRAFESSADGLYTHFEMSANDNLNPGKICAKCGAKNLRRSSLRLFEYFLVPVLLPYRCRLCDHRGLKLRATIRDLFDPGPKGKKPA